MLCSISASFTLRCLARQRGIPGPALSPLRTPPPPAALCSDTILRPASVCACLAVAHSGCALIGRYFSCRTACGATIQASILGEKTALCAHTHTCQLWIKHGSERAPPVFIRLFSSLSCSRCNISML
uniref:Uncharacterized protein n=1 Tax=Rhipicephalus zambeziensis TaxID=60191 RepID=A0A224YHU0_9ACAR